MKQQAELALADLPVAPPVPPSRSYSDSAAEELDVPDFLK